MSKNGFISELSSKDNENEWEKLEESSFRFPFFSATEGEFDISFCTYINCKYRQIFFLTFINLEIFYMMVADFFCSSATAVGRRSSIFRPVGSYSSGSLFFFPHPDIIL